MNNNPERFDPECTGEGAVFMNPWSNGEYVHINSYQELDDKLADTEKELEKYKNFFDAIELEVRNI